MAIRIPPSWKFFELRCDGQPFPVTSDRQTVLAGVLYVYNFALARHLRKFFHVPLRLYFQKAS